MSKALLPLVEATTLDAQQIAAGMAHIHASVLSQSKYIDVPNFTRIHLSDLELLFAEYDKAFFAGKVKESIGDSPLHFGLSKRMTSAGGKTATYTDRRTGRKCFEISVSTAILIGCDSN